MPRAGSTAARGYGTEHERLRKQWARRVDTGTVCCARPECGKPITPGTPWDLGHSDDRRTYTGPEHRTCNRRAGGQKRQQIARQPDVSRAWA